MNARRFESLLSGKYADLRPANWSSELSEDVQALRRVIQNLIPAHVEELDAELDEGTMKILFDSGLFSLTVPKACGGLQASVREFTACMEDIGGLGPAYGITTVPHLCISVSVVDHLGVEPHRSRILTAIREKQGLLAFAITEDSGSDLSSMKTTLHKDASGRLLLRGRKQWVTNLKRASHVTVAALCPDLHHVPGAVVLVLVPTDSPGIESTQPWVKLVANGSDTADLFFDDVEIHPEWLLGRPGDAFLHFNDLVLPGRLGAGSAAVGLADLSLGWARENHLLGPDEEAEWAALLDGCRCSLNWSASLVDEGDPNRSQAVAFAKSLACTVSQEIVDGVDWLCSVQGIPPPIFVQRSLWAMGLLRLLKGPGEVLCIQAVAYLAGLLRFATIPGEDFPEPLRTAVTHLVLTRLELEKSKEGRSQPVLLALGEALSCLQAIVALSLDGPVAASAPFLHRFQESLGRASRLASEGTEAFLETTIQLV